MSVVFISGAADYVCVLDIDLLELAITTWKGSSTGKLVSAGPLFTYLSFLVCSQQPGRDRSTETTGPARQDCARKQNIII